MKTIKIIKNEHKVYDSEEEQIEDTELNVLYFFLIDDYIDLASFLEWQKDKDADWVGTNLFFIKKENGNIILGFNGDYEHEHVFKTKPKFFADMLKQRDDIWEKEPQEFIIKLDDDGKVTLEYNEK